MTAERQPAGSPLAPVHGSARGPSAGATLLLVVAALVGAIAVAVITAPPPRPSPVPSAVALVSPTPPPSPASSARPSATPRPVVDATVIVLRGVADPATTLGTIAGCKPLLRVVSQGSAAIKGSDVDAAAVAAGRDTGWLYVPPGVQALTRVWLGDDVVELARAAGWPAVAVGMTGDVWLGGPAGAARWQPIATPAGRTAWVLTSDEITSRARCGPWPVPATVLGQRSLSCARVGAVQCLQFATQVEADIPGVPYPGGDLAVASPTCPLGPQSCGGPEFSAVAVPAGWTGTIDGVQAATVDPATGQFMLLAAGQAPGYGLAAISRPSLPLAVGSAAAAGADCSAMLTGAIRAAPWDPRVFWVGATGVVWPFGTDAQFGDLPTITVPTQLGSYRFVVGAPVRLEGSLDPRTHRFVACSVKPASVAAVDAPGASFR